jgi:hydroxymethylbilane synthase
MTNPQTITIASRESALAMWQARHVRDKLLTLHPGIQVSIHGMTTQGDRILDVTLSKIGGKGLFVKELEVALENGTADIAVHSMKDVPMNLPDGFTLAAVMEREDPRDAFVSSRYANLEALPAGGVIGTSSLRRESQLRARYPQLKVEPLRGNLQTRLRKLDEGHYDAIILAAAGLKRLSLAERIRTILAPEQSLPAVGQGALGIEIKSDRDDLQSLLNPLNDPETRWCVEAERAMSRALAGSCQVPLGGYAERTGAEVRMRGFVARPDGSVYLADEIRGRHDQWQPQALGQALADRLANKGARAILDELRE